MRLQQLLEPILAPFRRAKGRYMGVKQMKDGFKFDVKQAKQMASNAKASVGGAADKAKGAAGMAPAAPAAPKPPKVKKMGIFSRKRVCAQCGQPQDKTWDQCPFCMQAAQAAAAPAASPQKTMAFMANTAGGPTMQLLGWIVPIKGPLRGELFTLKSQSLVGTDPGTCDVVLVDPYMSSKHATIKAQGGVFMLEDLGSTNGTFVNDKRVKTHELVDNDFVKFGQTLVKFKSL